MPQIFISHSSDDNEFADRLDSSLTRLGYSTWLDFHDIRGGNIWRIDVDNGLEECEIMLIIISPKSMESKNVIEEFDIFSKSGRPIIPIRYKPAKMFYGLNSLQYVDFQTQPYVSAITQLNDVLSKRDIFPIKPLSDSIKINPNKTGNLFWLCHDLLELYRWLVSNIPKEWIDVGLRQSCHHAKQLGLNRDIVEYLDKLKDRSSSIQEIEWTEQKRMEFAAEVKNIFNIIAQEVQGADPNFDSGPG